MSEPVVEMKGAEPPFRRIAMMNPALIYKKKTKEKHVGPSIGLTNQVGLVIGHPTCMDLPLA